MNIVNFSIVVSCAASIFMWNAGLKVDLFLGNFGKRQFLFGKIRKRRPLSILVNFLVVVARFE